MPKPSKTRLINNENHTCNSRIIMDHYGYDSIPNYYKTKLFSGCQQIKQLLCSLFKKKKIRLIMNYDSILLLSRLCDTTTDVMHRRC